MNWGIVWTILSLSPFWLWISWKLFLAFGMWWVGREERAEERKRIALEEEMGKVIGNPNVYKEEV